MLLGAFIIIKPILCLIYHKLTQILSLLIYSTFQNYYTYPLTGVFTKALPALNIPYTFAATNG